MKKELIQDNMFVHHVFFWLKDEQNAAHKALLIAGLKKLSTVSTLTTSHIGVPAGTAREVIERSYAVSWLTVFADEAAHDRYQVDPVHLRFVEECKALWSKVQIFDSIDG